MNFKEKKQLISEIKKAYVQPKTRQKEAFLSKLSYPKSTFSQFAFDQLAFIRRRTWLISIALFVTMELLMRYNNFTEIQSAGIIIVSAFVPMLTLVSAIELLRSKRYGMGEMEMSTRFSLGTLMLVKMSWLGISNLVVLMTSALFMMDKIEGGFVRTGIYLLVPYLFTCNLSLWLIKKTKEKECVYYCATASGTVSLILLVLSKNAVWLYESRFTLAWAFICILLFILMLVESIRIIRNMEENKWNSLSIE